MTKVLLSSIIKIEREVEKMRELFIKESIYIILMICLYDGVFDSLLEKIVEIYLFLKLKIRKFLKIKLNKIYLIWEKMEFFLIEEFSEK